MTDDLAARRAARRHPTTVTTIDTIADLHGQLMAAQDAFGAALEALVHRGIPIQPAELQALLEEM